jgi:hypothetical protein
VNERPGTRRSAKTFERAERAFMSGLAALLTVICWHIFGPWGAWIYMVSLLASAGLQALYGLGLRRGERG